MIVKENIMCLDWSLSDSNRIAVRQVKTFQSFSDLECSSKEISLPMTPTVSPPKCAPFSFKGVKTVTPAQNTGAAFSRGNSMGILETNRAFTVIFWNTRYVELQDLIWCFWQKTRKEWTVDTCLWPSTVWKPSVVIRNPSMFENSTWGFGWSKDAVVLLYRFQISLIITNLCGLNTRGQFIRKIYYLRARSDERNYLTKKSLVCCENHICILYSVEVFIIVNEFLIVAKLKSRAM